MGLESHHRLAIAERLRGCADELEEAILTRILEPEGIPGSGRGKDGGLQHVVRNALDYALQSIEADEAQASPPPPALIRDARKAARRSLDLQVLLGRYLTGYSQFTDFLLREVERCQATPASRQVLQSTGAVFERLVAAIGAEYEAERQSSSRSVSGRRLAKAQDLLSGRAMTAPELSYDFSRCHVGMIGIGSDAQEAIRAVARLLDGQLLLLEASEGEAWGWVGRRRPISQTELGEALRRKPAPGSRLAVGEPASDLAGWRRTHREARSALAAATEGRRVARYVEVAVLSSLLQDPLLKRSLRERFLAPLRHHPRGERDLLLKTLRAYFATGRNAASAAAALGVTRQTVSSRLQLCEGHVGYPLRDCARELELALMLDELEAEQTVSGPVPAWGR